MPVKERDQRHQKLFSPVVLNSREFLKEKLNDYERLQARFLKSPNPKDQQALQKLRIERRALEKEIYPNLIIRLLRRGIVGLLLRKEAVKAEQKAVENQSAVVSSLQKVGLGNYSEQVINKLGHSGKEFSTFIAWQVSEKERLDLVPQFKRDLSGDFQMAGFQASIIGGNSKRHTVFIEAASGITADQAMQLLSGRAVHKSGEGWQVLDFNDKDESGNYRIRHVPDRLFDAGVALKTLPLKNGMAGEEIRQLLSGLEDGQRISVGLDIKGKDFPASIEADPKRNAISIYSKDNERVSVASLLNPAKELKLHKANRQQMEISTKKVSKGAKI